MANCFDYGTLFCAECIVSDAEASPAFRNAGDGGSPSVSSGCVRSSEVPKVGAASERAPGRESAVFEVEFVSKVDVCSAVKQVAEVQVCALQMNGVDLKVSPVQTSVGVVVIRLAFARSVLGALDRQCDATVAAEFAACILLPPGEAPALLILSYCVRLQPIDPLRDHEWRLKPDFEWRLEGDRIVDREPPRPQKATTQYEHRWKQQIRNERLPERSIRRQRGCLPTTRC